MLVKKLALQRLGEIVTDHVFSGTMLNHNITFRNLVRQIIVADVEGSGALTRTALPIGGEKNRGLVVLVENVLLDLYALGFHKMFHPQDLHRCIILSDQFSFRTTSSVKLLLPRDGLGHSPSIRHASSSVALEVGMDSERGIHPPLDNVEIISREDQLIVSGSITILHKSDELLPVVLIRVLNPGAQKSNSRVDIGPCSLASKETFCEMRAKRPFARW